MKKTAEEKEEDRHQESVLFPQRMWVQEIIHHPDNIPKITADDQLPDDLAETYRQILGLYLDRDPEITRKPEIDQDQDNALTEGGLPLEEEVIEILEIEEEMIGILETWGEMEDGENLW